MGWILEKMGEWKGIHPAKSGLHPISHLIGRQNTHTQTTKKKNKVKKKDKEKETNFQSHMQNIK